MFIHIFLFPALVSLLLVGAAVPLSRRLSLVAFALAAGAAGFAAFALPGSLRESDVVVIAAAAVGKAGAPLIALVLAWTAARLALAAGRALFGPRDHARAERGVYGPPHGFGGWFGLVALRLTLEPLVALTFVSIALGSSWRTATELFSTGYALTPIGSTAYLWWNLGVLAALMALMLPLVRALLRRTRAFRTLATIYLTATLTTVSLGFAFEVAVLGPAVALTAGSLSFLATMLAIDLALLLYIRRSKRVRATFSADPARAPTARAVVVRALASAFALSRWPERLARVWQGEAPLVPLLLVAPLVLLGYLAAQFVAVGLVQSLAITGAFALVLAALGVPAWRAALRIRRTYRFGALAPLLAALPIVAGATLVSHAHWLDVFAPGRAAVEGTVLRIEGGITSRLLDVVPRLLRERPDISRVELVSPGGRASVGIALSGVIRERGLATRAVSYCASACTFLFIAGRERDLAGEGRLGFHSPSAFGFSTGWDGLEQYLQDLRRLGATEAFMRRVMETPTYSMWYPTDAELIESGILTRRSASQPAAGGGA